MRIRPLAVVLVSALATVVPGVALPLLLAPAASAATVCAPDPWEADTPTAAAPIAAGQTVARAICQAPTPQPRTQPANDTDWFAFTASGTTAYTVSVVTAGTAVAGAGDGSGIRLGFRTVSAGGSVSSLPQNVSPDYKRATTEVLPAGRYLVSVRTDDQQFYPETNNLDVKTIQGDAGTYSIKLVTSAPAPTVASLSVAATTVKSGQPTTGTYVLDRPAPAGGMRLFSRSSEPAVIDADNIVVPAGATTGTFRIQTWKVGFTRTYTLGVYAHTGPTRSVRVTVTS